MFFAVCDGASSYWRVESPSVLTTLGSDIRQQSFTNNTFAVIQAAYFCSQFNENNVSFAHTRDANRNRHAVRLMRVENSNTKRVSLFLAHTVHSLWLDVAAAGEDINWSP